MAVTGVREVLAGFDRYTAAATKATCQVTADLVARVRAGARANLSAMTMPWDGQGPFEGRLIDQIRGQVVPNEPIGAVFVERTVSGNKGTDNRGLWMERGVAAYGIGSRPFLRPAAEAERNRYFRELTEALDVAKRSVG